MANKKNVQSMTPEELAAYVEVVRQRNAANAKKYYKRSTKNLKSNVLKLPKNIIHVQIIDLNKLKIKRY